MTAVDEKKNVNGEDQNKISMMKREHHVNMELISLSVRGRKRSPSFTPTYMFIPTQDTRKCQDNKDHSEDMKVIRKNDKARARQEYLETYQSIFALLKL